LRPNLAASSHIGHKLSVGGVGFAVSEDDGILAVNSNACLDVGVSGD